MKKLFLSAVVIFVLFRQTAAALETRDMPSVAVQRIHTQIDSEISHVMQLADKELSGLPLNSSDISKRIRELTRLEAEIPSHMAALGYTHEQEERYRNILSEVLIAYSSYNSMIFSINQDIEDQIPEDTVSPAIIMSPDINMSDALVKEITKISRGIDMMFFYLREEIDKLNSYLSEISELKANKPTNNYESVFLPDIHELRTERAMMNAAVSRFQLTTRKRLFDGGVSLMLGFRKRLDYMQMHLVFTQEILDKNIDNLELGIRSLLREMDSVAGTLNTANEALIRAKSALKPGEENSLTQAAAEYMLRFAEANYWQYRVSLLHDEIAFKREAITLWRNRYKLFHNELHGMTIWTLREETAARMEEQQQQLNAFRALESASLRHIDDLLLKTQTTNLSDDVKQTFIRAVDIFRITISEVFNRYEALIPDAMLLQRRLHYEADEQLNALHIAEGLGSFSYETVMKFLNTPLWRGSEGYTVTVQNLIIAILVFLSSFVLSSLGSRWVRRGLMKRVRRKITAVDAVQRIVFYILWIALALTALNIVKIPLTAFAFMGGAFVLGLGFGMQDIFNNLISGFILIFSRPFKTYDIIDVLGTQGWVMDIGSRSTVIRTWDDSDVILPNKYFLENSVTNWTRGDFKKREVLEVGISYTSSIKKAEEVLNYVVKTQPDILKSPVPFVEFKDFGESSINFSIYYWIDLSMHKPPHGPSSVVSRIRRRIFALFALEGVEIPYPHVNVHIAKE